MNHDCLPILWDAVKCLLDNMTTEGVHAQVESVVLDGHGDADHLRLGAVLEAALNQEVAEAVDHQWVGVSYDCVDDIELLSRRAKLKLLLKKD